MSVMSVAPKLVVTTERRISPTRVGSALTAFLRRVTRNVLLHTSSIQPYTGRELIWTVALGSAWCVLNDEEGGGSLGRTALLL